MPAREWENLVPATAIAILFGVRKFLLNRHDMVEIPDGLVEIDNNANKEKEN